MDLKVIRSIVAKPWLIDPMEAQKLFAAVMPIFKGQTGGISRFAEKVYQPEVINGVAVVPVNGPLMKSENCGEPGTANILTTVRQFAADSTIRGIVLHIDSPGGTVDGTQVFADAIKQISKNKPVVAFVDGMMASAAYWIGSSASHIMASTENDLIGSIGTMCSWADFSGYFEKEGVKIHEAYATDSVDKNSLFRDANAGDHSALIKTLLDPVNGTFTNAVKANRSGKLDLAVENVLTGKIYTAKKAMKFGLIDSIGNMDKAIALAASLSTQPKKMETKQFANTLAAAKVEALQPLVANVATETEANGFLVPETAMENLEATLTQLQAALQATNENNTALQKELDAANTQAAQVAQLEAQLATANDRIAELEATDGAKPTGAGKNNDEFGDGKPDPLSDPNSPLNQAAAALGL